PARRRPARHSRPPEPGRSTRRPATPRPRRRRLGGRRPEARRAGGGRVGTRRSGGRPGADRERREGVDDLAAAPHPGGAADDAEGDVGAEGGAQCGEGGGGEAEPEQAGAAPDGGGGVRATPPRPEPPGG